MEGSGARERVGEEGNSEIEESSTSGGVDESTLRSEEIGGRSIVEDDSPGRERFLFEARLF